MAKKYLSAEELEILWRENGARISQAIKDSNSEFNLKFLDAKKHDITQTMSHRNQILVVYKNGRFEVLPTSINGQIIKDYLGVQFTRIKMWAAFPTPGHTLHPISSATGPRSAFDIYEY
jgi:hypothetical protein